MASSLDLGALGQSRLKWPIWPHRKHLAAACAASISIGAQRPPYVVPVAVFFSGMYVNA